MCNNKLKFVPVAKLCNSSSSRGKVTDNIAEAVARDIYVNFHYRLKYDRVSLRYTIFQTKRTGELKSKFRGIDLVV